MVGLNKFTKIRLYEAIVNTLLVVLSRAHFLAVFSQRQDPGCYYPKCFVFHYICSVLNPLNRYAP